MPITVTPLSPALGAEIGNADIATGIGEEDFRDILHAWHRYALVVLPGQSITEEQQMAFGARFGALAPWSQFADHHQDESKNPYIMLVSNLKENGEYIGSLPDGEIDFHSDGIYTETPQTATMLYAVEIPKHGGDTLFANMYMAYETLPDDFKERLEGKTALHSFTYNSQTIREAERKKSEGETTVGCFSHPVFRTHPVTGRKALYVNRLMTQEIEGLGPGEGRRLLDFLFDHSERPEFIYTHHWRPRDLLIWDNRCLNHGRGDFDPLERRLMRRLTIAGERPF